MRLAASVEASTASALLEARSLLLELGAELGACRAQHLELAGELLGARGRLA